MKALALNIPDRWQRMSDFKNALSYPSKKVSSNKQETKRNFISEPRQKRNKKNKTILPFLIPVFLIVGIAIIWLIISVMIPNYKYNSAVKLMNSGNYNEAITAFTDLGSFKESELKISECEDLKREERFEYMLALFSSGTADQTVEAFNILEEYSDSEYHEKAINHEVQVLLEMEPENAAAILESIKYDDAVLLMNRINDYDSVFCKTILPKCGFRIQAAFLEIGDSIQFGTYEQDNILENGKEKIEWLILDKKDGNLLLISQFGLDCEPYNSRLLSVTWETSTLREWLNSDFLNSAFSSEDQEFIQISTVISDKNPNYNTNPENNTEDMIFLLSANEAKHYFSSHSERKIKVTEYAKAKGALTNKKGYTSWWLLTSGYISLYSVIVSTDGEIYSYGISVNNSKISVRPALWIKINK